MRFIYGLHSVYSDSQQNVACMGDSRISEQSPHAHLRQRRKIANDHRSGYNDKNCSQGKSRQTRIKLDQIGSTLMKRISSPCISQVSQREIKLVKLTILEEATNSAASAGQHVVDSKVCLLRPRI